MSEVKPVDHSRSKIGRLMFNDRMQFNRLVRDGYTGRVLSDWLSKHGVPDVSAENIRKYKHAREYREWLSQEDRVNADREKAEQTMRLAEAIGGSASAKVQAILASKIYAILPDLNTVEDLKGIVSSVQSVVDAERVELTHRQVTQRDSLIALEKDKFRWKLAERLIVLAKDEHVKAIAGKADATQEQKITELLAYMDRVEDEAIKE